MASIRLVLAVPLLSAAALGGAWAQGFSAPGGDGQAAPMMQPPAMQQPMTLPGGMPPGGMPPGAGMPAMPPGGGMPAMSGGSPGFGSPPATPAAPTQPARQNFADELTDFGVQPQADLQDNVGSPTPTTIPGGHLITTAEMRQAVGSNILIVDVLAAPPHPTLPGALLMPGAGNGGSFNDTIQQQFWSALSQAAKMNPAQPIVFLCAGSRCWESYNAALRAEHMGFKMVLWYRGGLASWQAAGLPLTMPGNPAPSSGRSPGFGNNPG